MAPSAISGHAAMPIRLMENFRALLYAPFYAAHALGFFAREGVEVELLTSSTPGSAIPRLLAGSIHLTWAGPMRVMKAHDDDPRCRLACFGEVVSRDPFFLIARRDAGASGLRDLARLELGSVSEVPTPWMCLQHDLREIGIDPAGIARVRDRTMEENYAALRAGKLDVMQAFEPYATWAGNDGVGGVIHAASERGPTVYTTFVTTREALAEHRAELLGITRATAQMQKWLHDRGAEALTEATAGYFRGIAPDVLNSSFRRYLAAGLWAREPAISRQGFLRLGQSLLSGGYIRRMVPYESCVAETLNRSSPEPAEDGRGRRLGGGRD
jgi:NitT/TauT family transport system substrate-binding protein